MPHVNKASNNNKKCQLGSPLFHGSLRLESDPEPKWVGDTVFWIWFLNSQPFSEGRPRLALPSTWPGELLYLELSCAGLFFFSLSVASLIACTCRIFCLQTGSKLNVFCYLNSVLKLTHNAYLTSAWGIRIFSLCLSSLGVMDIWKNIVISGYIHIRVSFSCAFHNMVQWVHSL